MNNREVILHVQGGGRHACPPRCPATLHRVMLDCWKEDPAARPTFASLKHQMEDFFSDTAAQLYNEADRLE